MASIDAVIFLLISAAVFYPLLRYEYLSGQFFKDLKDNYPDDWKKHGAPERFLNTDARHLDSDAKYLRDRLVKEYAERNKYARKANKYLFLIDKSGLIFSVLIIAFATYVFLNLKSGRL